jgi:ribosomal-protein-serine acetyltransferase
MAYDAIRLDERLTLRPPGVEDAQAICDIVERDNVYLGKYLPWAETVPSLEDQTRYIETRINRDSSFRNERSGNRSEWYAIQLDSELVGGIELMISDLPGNKGELGYWLASHVQGMGIITRAVQALTVLGFGELHLKAMWIYAETGNWPSRRVAERSGYVLQGEFPRKLHLRNDPVIMAGYFAISTEWELPN